MVDRIGHLEAILGRLPLIHEYALIIDWDIETVILALNLCRKLPDLFQRRKISNEEINLRVAR